MKTSRFLYDGLHDLPPSEVLGKPTLRLTTPYMQGAHVRDAQMKLVAAGFPLQRYGIDGVYGSETQSAVKQFQSANGISVDGVVGTETWMALYAITPGGGTGFNYPVVTGSGNGSEIDWHTIKTWGLIAVSAVLGVGVLTNSTSKSNSKKKRK